MAMTLTIGAVSQTAFLQEHTATLKLRTLDCTLVDPATIPALGDVVAVTDPIWNGTVTGLKRRPGPRPGHDFAVVTATNDAVAYASVAPFGLSDTPNGSTTYGYDRLEVSTTSDAQQAGFQVDSYQANAFSTGTTATVSGTCVFYQTGLWPAMTFLLTNADLGYAGTNFTAQEVVVTWTKGTPRYALTFGDPIVTMSVWLASKASDDILPITTNDLVNNAITSTKISDEAVTTPKLAANSVIASKIQAGSIAADKLTAELILTTLIASGTSGNRWEADSDGIRLFDSSDGLLVNMPTDGSPVIVAGQVTADSLVVTGNTELQGTGNSLSQASSTTAQAGVQPPSAAPSLVAGWPTGVSLAKPSLTSYDISGGYYDSAGGTSGATACWVALVGDHDAGVVKVYEWTLSTGAVNRITTLNNGAIPFSFTAGQGFITRIGGFWFVRALNDLGRTIAKFDRSTGGVDSEINGGIGLALTNDGTFLYQFILTGGTYYIDKYDTSLGFVSRAAITNLPSGFGSGQDLLLLANTGGGNNFYIADSVHSNILEVTTAYAVTNNAEFPPSKPLSVGNGFIWDGTQFQMVAWTTTTTNAVSKHTNWTWTTASPIYWVAYAWYDITGTTHETDVGPRQSITMGRRKQLTVGNAAIPVGGVDTPDRVRTYMLPNATDPGAGAFKLQATDALTTRALTTYNSGGAADGGGTPFVGGIGAVVQSAGAGWILRGNGSMNLGGASFPGSPVTGDVYYRTDLDILFKYDGTRWLSTDLIPMRLDSFDALNATRASTGIGPAPTPSGGSDIYLVDLVTQFLVNGGTALSASHKWVGAFNKQPTGNTDTLVSTVTIDSGASSVWRVDTQTIDALLNNGTTHYDFTDAWTKTGTPGTLFVRRYVTYRIVAT